jgi:hypothetical protein
MPSDWSPPDFSGAWAVDTKNSDSLAAVLTLMGVPWLAQKVALALDIVTVIKHDVSSIQVSTTEKTNFGVLQTNDMLADGVSVQRKGADGRLSRVTCSVYRAQPDVSSDGTVLLGVMRITTELPDGMGVTDNTWTLCAGGDRMLQLLRFSRGGKEVAARRTLVLRRTSQDVTASPRRAPAAAPSLPRPQAREQGEPRARRGADMSPAPGKRDPIVLKLGFPKALDFCIGTSSADEEEEGYLGGGACAIM